ncbi:MAG: hydantoinase/oxoprolinase family protein [Desulforhopalus sp.]
MYLIVDRSFHHGISILIALYGQKRPISPIHNGKQNNLATKNMQKYIIGIDTGGTYTDAVLLDTESGKIITTAKKPTSHHKLSNGTGEALDTLFTKSAVAPEHISAVVVSSTLATNSVVESKGARVAVIVIGYVKHFKLPVKAVVFVKGGHTIQGNEEEPLDVDYLVQLVNGLKAEVDAYGVCSAMSMKNPTHELVAEKAISMLDPKPVFCSHRISDLVGMQERASTAGLHAKLMPVMQEFVDGVKEAMVANKLDSRLLVVAGNGQAMEADKIVKEAGLTVASGPACTAHFGASRSEGDSLVIDVGGTTTDIAMVENGRPLLAKDGCQIGRWKTHVEAIDMHTGGIGGDSHVHVDGKGRLTIGPARVTPLSMATKIVPVAEWLGSQNCSKLIVLRPESVDDVPDNELTRLLLEAGQLTPATIRARTGLGGIPLAVQLEQLARKQQIYECGFTPTDALHVLGKIDIGKREMALAGAALLGKAVGMSGEAFSRLVVRKTEDHIENLIIDYVVQRYWKKSLNDVISSRKDHPALGIDFSIKLPLIGIGAAARYFLPNVAKNLKTTVVFPEHCEVGNGIGAAIIGMSAHLS